MPIEKPAMNVKKTRVVSALTAARSPRTLPLVHLADSPGSS
jgi:hypothetical protein